MTSRLLVVRETREFRSWFGALRDEQARSMIDARIKRLALGNPGDVAPVGQGVSEMRVNAGPGYRVYYKQHGEEWVILLAGGDKKTQDKDVELALKLAPLN